MISATLEVNQGKSPRSHTRNLNLLSKMNSLGGNTDCSKENHRTFAQVLRNELTEHIIGNGLEERIAMMECKLAELQNFLLDLAVTVVVATKKTLAVLEGHCQMAIRS